MNANTIVGFLGGTGRNQIASQTLASTTETELQINTDDGNGAIAVLTVPQQTSIAGASNPLDPSANSAVIANKFGRQVDHRASHAPWFNADTFDNRPFLVRVCGLATPASNAGNTLAIKLYLGASKAGTNIATTAATAQATTTTPKPFILEAQLVWSSVSRTVVGQFWWKLDATSSTEYATWATLSNDGATTDIDDLNFCVSATWGNAVGGVVAASEFSISQL